MFLRWVWMLQSKSWAASVRQVKRFLSWLISTDPIIFKRYEFLEQVGAPNDLARKASSLEKPSSKAKSEQGAAIHATGFALHNSVEKFSVLSFLHGYQSTCQHLMPCRAVGLWVCLYDFFQHGSSKIFILTDCITVITGYKRGKRQHLGSNHHLLQLTSQRPNHRRPTGGRKLYLDYSGFQGCSDCWEKSCSNPSTTRGGSGGGRLEFFLSRLILSSMDLFYISYHPGGLL